MNYFKQVTSWHVVKLFRTELLQVFSKEDKSYIGIMKMIKQLHIESQVVSHVAWSPRIVSHGNARNPTNYWAYELHFWEQPLNNTTKIKLQHIEHPLLPKMLHSYIWNIRPCDILVTPVQSIVLCIYQATKSNGTSKFVPCQPFS
jgi:hypothetical protein